ncbi:MAG TPA: hypothetical protein VJ783_09340 [Pirellulales bacterium]|nr:hypothetical protein [Pirellulales bacterium]
MAHHGFRCSRRHWLLVAIPIAIAALQAARAIEPSKQPTTTSGLTEPGRRTVPLGPPRLVDRLRRWFSGPRRSTDGGSEVRHFDAYEFWALERDERRRH